METKRLIPLLRRPSDYYILDEFSETLAGGAVDGTPARPTGGLRDLTDTESLITLSSGACNMASRVSPSNGDPSIFYDQRVRTPGLMFGTKVTLPNTTKFQKIGFKASGTTNPLRGNINFNSAGALRVDDNNAAAFTAGLGYTATGYTAMVGQRTAGCFYFLNGGVYSNMVCLGHTDVDTTTPLIPVLSNYDGTAAYDWAMMPKRRYLPVPLASDGFSAWGTTDGLGHPDTAGLGSGGSGVTWTNQLGTWGVTSGAAQPSALSGGRAIATVPLNNLDVIINCTLTRAAGEIGIVLRYYDADNFVMIVHDGTNLIYRTRLGGVESDTTGAAAFGGGKLQVWISGTNIVRIWNNVKIGSTSSLLNQAVNDQVDSARYGIVSSDLGNTVDNFSIYATGNRGEYNDIASLFRVTPASLVVFDGNSLTQGLTPIGDSYPNQVIASLGTAYTHINFGVGGQNIDDMNTDAATEIDPWFDPRRPKNICVPWEGTIILASQSAAYAYAALKTYWAARRAAGWKVVAMTVLPASGMDTAKRASLNALITGDTSLYDALANVAGDSRIGDDGDEADTTYYNVDQVHLNATGYGVVAGIVTTAIQSL